MSLVLGLVGLVFGPLGCGGGAADEAGPRAVEEVGRVPGPELQRAWPVALAAPEDFAPFASQPGWVTLTMQRDYRRAVEQLGPLGGLAAARAHAEAAALYRQAALLAANSLVQAFGETPEHTDPVGAAHLLSVSYILKGKLELAREQSARLDGVAGDPTLPWHAPWKRWLEAGAAWPPDLADLPITLPAPAAGGWPVTAELPHYALPEQGSDLRRDMGDPGLLVALALWHDAAAALAAGERAALLPVYRARYRLPVEGPVAPGEPLPMELVFASDLLGGEDGPFLADVHGPAGAGAVEAWADRSLLARVASLSRVDGRIDAERAVDVVVGLRADLVAAAAARTGGEVQGHQPMFADVAMVGTLRNLALIAEVEGDRETSGILRIDALERSEKATACPVGMLALGAWDADNRYPLRALDILHAQSRRFPSLETARYGLDAMALRVSREQTGPGAGM